MAIKDWAKNADNFVRGVANTATFGAADYIAGAADSAFNGKSIPQNIHDEKQRSKDAANEGTGNFNSYNAGVVGGVVLDAWGAARAIGTHMAEKELVRATEHAGNVKNQALDTIIRNEVLVSSAERASAEQVAEGMKVHPVIEESNAFLRASTEKARASYHGAQAVADASVASARGFGQAIGSIVGGIPAATSALIQHVNASDDVIQTPDVPNTKGNPKQR